MQKQIEKHKETKQNVKAYVKETSKHTSKTRHGTHEIRQEMPKRHVFDRMKRTQDHLTCLCVGVRARLIILYTVSDFFEYFWLVYRVTPQEEQAIVPYSTPKTPKCDQSISLYMHRGVSSIG
jgi:hypothetical protein